MKTQTKKNYVSVSHHISNDKNIETIQITHKQTASVQLLYAVGPPRAGE